jgi:hypothetical protein
MDITSLDVSDDQVAGEVADISEETEEKEEFKDNEYIDLDKEAEKDADYTEDISSDDDKPEADQNQEPVPDQTQVLKELAESFRQTNEQNRQQMTAIMEALAAQKQTLQPEKDEKEISPPEITEDEWINDPVGASQKMMDYKLQQAEQQRQEAEKKQQERQKQEQQLQTMQTQAYHRAVELVPDVGKQGTEVRRLTTEILNNMNQGNAVLFATLAAHYLIGGTMQNAEGLDEVREQARAQERSRIDRTKKTPVSPGKTSKEEKMKFSPEEVQTMKDTGVWGDKELMETYATIRGNK